jgi:hypothetical protein
VNKRVAECDPAPLDRAFAVKWYAEGWIDCWNSNRPQRVREILTEDFVLDAAYRLACPGPSGDDGLHPLRA